MSPNYPQPAPDNFLGWVELAFSWLLTSVVWGLIPLAVTLFFAIGIGMSPDLSNELRVGGTVLALSLCGTQFLDDIPIPQRQLKRWKWLKNISIILVAFGAVAATLNVVYGAGASSGAAKVNLGVLNFSALIVFVGALVVSFFAFLIRVIAASESFEQAVDERRKTLSQNAATKNEVDGIKI